jgi:diguanylate cyclase (GGDEF)-like protein/PAS domain S-box-containing protein
LFNLPFALITLIDAERQWLKSAEGMAQGSEHPRNVSFCAHAILDPSKPLIVSDATQDPRFTANPLVTGSTGIRFYAGVPILNEAGEALGAFCILDVQARSLSTDDIEDLEGLAFSVSKLIQADTAALKWRESEENHRWAVALSPQSLWTANSEGKIIQAGDRLLAMLGATLEQVHGTGWTRYLAPEERDEVTRAWDCSVRTGLPLDIEFRFFLKDGSPHWFRSRAMPRYDPSGKIVRWYGTIEDVTDRKMAELALKQREDRLETVLESTTDLVAFYDTNWRITYMNSALKEMQQLREMMGKVIWEAMPELQGTELEHHLLSAKATNEPRQFEWFSSILNAWIEVNAYPTPEGLSVFLRNVNEVHQLQHERRNAQQRLIFQASHDALTGLPNRMRLHDQLTGLLAGATQPSSFTLMVLGLDSFKAVNDTLGPAIGDKLLQQVAERLRQNAPRGTRVARLGGDEFSILQTGLVDPQQVVTSASALIEVIGKPYEVDGNTILVSASIGMAVAPEDGASPDQLLRAAGIALYRAKEEARGTWRLFAPDMQQRLEERERLRLGLSSALARQEFILFYQPLIDLPSGRVGGFEALLRWKHPLRGFVSPTEFIPAAEESGLIVPMGTWILRQACQEAMRWPGEIRVAVNLSPVQFRAPDLPKTVSSILEETGLPPGRLKLEITEAVLLQDSEANLATLHALRQIGVLLVLDDFGTGYSSLGYLQRFPFDKLKVDQSFVRHLIERQESQAIVQSILGLAKALKIGTTAEGVETQKQLDWLLDAGCGQAQGYLFSRPMPADNILPFLSLAEGNSKPGKCPTIPIVTS